MEPHDEAWAIEGVSGNVEKHPDNARDGSDDRQSERQESRSDRLEDDPFGSAHGTNRDGVAGRLGSDRAARTTVSDAGSLSRLTNSEDSTR